MYKKINVFNDFIMAFSLSLSNFLKNPPHFLKNLLKKI